MNLDVSLLPQGKDLLNRMRPLFQDCLRRYAMGDASSVRVETAESALRVLGFRTVRVRCHDDLARIEVDRAERARLLDESVGSEVLAVLTRCGFRYVTLDLQGYRMGSFNAPPSVE